MKDKEHQALVLKEGKMSEGQKMDERSRGTMPSGQMLKGRCLLYRAVPHKVAVSRLKRTKPTACLSLFRDPIKLDKPRFP